MEFYLRLILLFLFWTSYLSAISGCGDQSDSAGDICSNGTQGALPNYLSVSQGQGRRLCSCDIEGKVLSALVNISVKYSGKDDQKCDSYLVFRHYSQSAITIPCNASQNVFSGLPIKIDYVGSLGDTSPFCLRVNESSTGGEVRIICKEPQTLPPLSTPAVPTTIGVESSTPPGISIQARIVSASVGGIAAIVFVILVVCFSRRRLQQASRNKTDHESHNGRALGMEIECHSNFAEMYEIDNESQSHENEEENDSEDSFPPPPPSGLDNEEGVTQFRSVTYSTKLGDIEEEVSYECDDDGSQYRSRITRRVGSQNMEEETSQPPAQPTD